MKTNKYKKLISMYGTGCRDVPYRIPAKPAVAGIRVKQCFLQEKKKKDKGACS
jgi:hypothetical protein